MAHELTENVFFKQKTRTCVNAIGLTKGVEIFLALFLNYSREVTID